MEQNWEFSSKKHFVVRNTDVVDEVIVLNELNLPNQKGVQIRVDELLQRFEDSLTLPIQLLLVYHLYDLPQSRLSDTFFALVELVSELVAPVALNGVLYRHEHLNYWPGREELSLAPLHSTLPDEPHLPLEEARLYTRNPREPDGVYE